MMKKKKIPADKKKENNNEDNDNGEKKQKEKETEKDNFKKTTSTPEIESIIKKEEKIKMDDSSKDKRSPTLANVRHKNIEEFVPLKKTIHNRFDIKLIKKALKSKRVLRLFLMGIFSAPLGNFIMNTWRNIGIRKGIQTRYLQNIGTYSPFAMFSSAFIFSALSDYLPFRYLVSILSLCCSINGILFCFSLNNPIFFTVVLLTNTFLGMGIGSVYEPHFLKVFGIKHYLELGGVISLSGVIMGPICTVFIFIFENIFAESINSKDGSDFPYYVLFITASLLNVISSVLAFFESEEEISSE